ncbi:hypothetical protein H1R20_g11299, partial [Candolleomyces eurysporus]
MPAGLPGLASRKRKLDNISQHLGDQIDKRSTSRYAKESGGSHTGILPSTVTLQPLPQPLPVNVDGQSLNMPSTQSSEELSEAKRREEKELSDAPKPKGPSQTTQTLDDFMSILPSLVNQVIAANIRTSKLNERSTLKSPRTAFSFRVLKQFHLQHLESKQSAQDFCSSLQRLTDNALTSKVSDIYEQFLVVMQVWRIVTAVKRAGAAHGIDDILTHRIRGNLIVHCPSCPEVHMNMEDGWERTPPHLRHLNQSRCTCDGNHHANHYCKNTDPQSKSLFRGRSYYPKEEDYQAYLKCVESSMAEKSTCMYLNAMNKQDRKKFKHMNVTGIVNIQCDHVVVKSSADMQLGEQFRNSDYAVAHSIRQHRNLDVSVEKQYDTCLDRLFSYDIGCGWDPGKDKRFSENLPDVAPTVRKMRTLIPLLHVQNHKDNCMYLFSCSYTENAGHFHGETAEQYWVELNQLGPQTRQMNNGHHQDTIIDAHSHWNWKKIQNMGKSLSKAAIDARALYTQHRDHFSYLSQMNGKARVGAWSKLNRQERKMEGQEIQCVYRERAKKVPSQKKIYDCLVLELEKNTASNSELQGSSPVVFIHEGLKISLIQTKIKHLAHEFRNHPTTSQESSIADQRSKLRTRIDKFRLLQKHVYSSKHAVPLVPRKTSYSTPEYEELYLPSSFSLQDRQRFELGPMANQELKLREGMAFDKIRELQELSKVLSVDLDGKRDARGVKQNTRSGTIVRNLMSSQAQAIDDYNINRAAMIKLDEASPPTTSNSTIKEKSRLLKDGWIWDIGALGQFSTQEIEEWSKEGDHVQWFRAEAEMERWREEYETRLADLLRCIRYFKRMNEVWLELSTSRSSSLTSNLGHAIYAHTRAEMYKQLASDAEGDLKAVVPDGISLAKGEILADYVQRMRKREDAEYAAEFPLGSVDGTSDTEDII